MVLRQVWGKLAKWRQSVRLTRKMCWMSNYKGGTLASCRVEAGNCKFFGGPPTARCQRGKGIGWSSISRWFASQILIFCSYFQACNVPRPLLGQIHEVKSRGQERRGCAISKPSRTSIPFAHPKTKWKRLENRSPASWPWSSDWMAKTQLGSPAAAIGARGRHGSWLIQRFLQPLVSTPDW